MPQVLRPNDYTETTENTDFGTFEISRQVLYSRLTAIILGAWLVATYLNEGLFFKEVVICSCIIFFLVFIKTKSIKKEFNN